MNNLPMNVVNLGNKLFACVKFERKKDLYHLESDKESILNVSINENNIIWSVPKDVFEDSEDHAKFKIIIYSFSDADGLVVFRKVPDDKNPCSIIVRPGINELISWGNAGGDLCIINPDSNVSTMMTKHRDGEITKLYVQTFRQNKTFTPFINFSYGSANPSPSFGNAGFRRANLSPFGNAVFGSANPSPSFGNAVSRSANPSPSFGNAGLKSASPNPSFGNAVFGSASPKNAHFATVGKSTQTFTSRHFDKDLSTEVSTIFHFNCTT